MSILDKIENYLKKPRYLKEDIEESNIQKDITELLNGLDDEFLDERQLMLKNRIFATISSEENQENQEDIEDEDIEMDKIAQEVDDELNDIEIENIGDKEKYGYDENDIQKNESHDKNYDTDKEKERKIKNRIVKTK